MNAESNRKLPAEVRLVHDRSVHLAESLAASEAVMRLAVSPMLAWRSEPFDARFSPVISIGHFQSWKDVPEGMDFVRRRSGGNLVRHDNKILFGLLFPAGHPLYGRDPEETLELASRATQKGLEQLGLRTRRPDSAAAPDGREGHGGCYDQRFRFDIFLDETKCAAFTYNRSRHALLQHISFQLPDPALHPPLIASLQEALMPLLGPASRPSELDPEEHRLGRELLEKRYKTDAWNKMR